MTVYKAVANEAVATLDIAKAILAGDPVDQALIDDAGWDFEANLDTETYTTSDSGHAATSVLLVPDHRHHRELRGSPGCPGLLRGRRGRLPARHSELSKLHNRP